MPASAENQRDTPSLDLVLDLKHGEREMGRMEIPHHEPPATPAKTSREYKALRGVRGDINSLI